MSKRTAFLTAVLLSGLVGCSANSVNLGDKGVSQFTEWNKAHTLDGGSVTSVDGQNTLPFSGALLVQVHVDPPYSEAQVHHLMDQLCAFNKTDPAAQAGFELTLDRVTTRVGCDEASQARQFAFYAGISKVPGLIQATDTPDIEVTLERSTFLTGSGKVLAVAREMAGLADQISVHADQTWRLNAKTGNLFTDQLTSAEKVAAAAGDSITGIQIDAQGVVISTNASTSQAALWQDAGAFPQLYVAPLGVSTDHPLSPRLGRAVTSLKEDPSVQTVQVADGNVDAYTTQPSADVARLAQKTAAQLGSPITVNMGDKARTCRFPVYDTGLAQSLQITALCTHEGVTAIDVTGPTRAFGVIDDAGLAAVVVYLHTLPPDRTIDIRMYPPGQTTALTAEFTLGPTLTFDQFTNPDLKSHINTLWTQH